MVVDVGKRRIACVVVTHNRLELLKETLQAVLNQSLQPDILMVVDNKSTDGTRQWLIERAESNPSIAPIMLDKNTGGAGGFHYGIKKAYGSGYNWFWLMDDDCIPERDALENLITSAASMGDDIEPELGFLASRVCWTDGERHIMNIPRTDYKWWSYHPKVPYSIRIAHASFVSVLINARAVQKVGLPIKEFFIWHDDVEYTDRITRNNFLAFSIETSRVIHKTPLNRGPDYTDIRPQDLWKWKYGARNWVAFRKYQRYGWIKALRQIYYMWSAMLRHRVAPHIQMPILWSAFRGLLFNYRKLIEYPEEMKTVAPAERLN